MFGVLDLFVKQVNEQIADYAATQARIVGRAFGAWQDAIAVVQPVRIETHCSLEGRLRQLALRQDRRSGC